MLLDDEQKEILVNRIIKKAKQLLAEHGQERTDSDTGFVHQDCYVGTFVMVEHHRQRLANGMIRTNGLDLWKIVDGNARKQLSVNYMPYELKYFDHAGRAPWIQEFLDLGAAPEASPETVT